MQPIYEFGGNGSILHVAVANGFPPQTYQPLVQPLTAHFRAVSLLPRALWPGELPPQTFIDWRDTLARDLIDGLRAYDLRDVVAVGHSFGGIASLLAAIAEPERFRALILLDPTILPPAIMRLIPLGRQNGQDTTSGLADRADKRRDRFESVEAAYTYFKGKRLFADWPDEALRRYAESVIPAPEGGFMLAWPREWEAYYFRTFYAGTWNDLPHLRGKLPLLTVRGGTSNTLLPESVEQMHRILPEMAYAEISGHGHLFPQTAPEETHRVIADWLAGL
jgi:pimeloyl-ACP methyl ester carboxylesterase